MSHQANQQISLIASKTQKEKEPKHIVFKLYVKIKGNPFQNRQKGTNFIPTHFKLNDLLSLCFYFC